MNRHLMLLFLSIATTVIATGSQADAQLFRRWRAAQQPAGMSQYQQQQQQYQQQQAYRQRYQPNTRPGTQSSEQPRSNVPSANYSRVPKVVGTVDLRNQDASARDKKSRTPTFAKEPKKVTDNPELTDDEQSDSRKSSSRDEEELGQSILSREKDGDSARGESGGKKEAAKSAATMGLEVYQQSTPQNGVRVARISERSLAGESGLRVGDMIVAVDRTRTRSAKDIASVLRSHQPGSSLRVQFVRGRMAYVTNVPLIASKVIASKSSKDVASSKAPSAKSTAKQGRVTAAKPPTATVTTQTQSSRIKLGMLIQDPTSLRGTVVTKVRPGSIADASGLEAGDRIVSVETRLLESGDRLREIISELNWGDQLAMGIVRDGELISRKIRFTETPDRKLASSKPTSKSQAKSPKESSSNLGTGLGSMLGGLFSGATQAKGENSEIGDSVVNAVGELPNPSDSSGYGVDSLDFGDDEPIEQVIFQKKTAPR